MTKSIRWIAAILLLLLGAYTLRVYRLDAQSIWWDEGISLHLATSGTAEIVADRLNNIHPPLYFFLLKGWLALTGVSPFTGRYLSVIAGLLQVALVFAAVRYWRGRARLAAEKRAPALPWLAAGLVALSPLSVIYSQEIRVYALLPGVYLVIVVSAEYWAGERGGKRAGGKESPLLPRSSASRLLILLAVVEWFSLHLHYTALFAVAYMALWVAWSLARRRDWPALRRWLAAQALVTAASLPWFLAVVANAAAVQAEANAGTFTTEPVPLGFLLAQVWAFQLTGLAGSLGHSFVRVAATVAAVVGGGLLLMTAASAISRSASPRRATVTLRLAAHWAVPLAAALLAWSVRSFSHPRYVIMFAALLIPLLAFLMLPTPTRPRRVAAALLGAAVLALSLWGLRQHFTNPAKPDMRDVARHLEATAAAGDLILIPDTDWSLPFEYRGAAAVVMPQAHESSHSADNALTQALDCTGKPCATSRRVFVVDYPRGTRDWQGRVPFELARRGQRVTTTEFDDLTVQEYQLGRATGPLPACDAAGVALPAVSFGPLTLGGAWLAQGTASDTAVAVALCWRLDEATIDDLAVTLILRDPVTGETVAQADTSLLDTGGVPTSHWLAGRAITSYHVLPLPPGTPPVTLSLLGGVYAAAGGDIRPFDAIGNSGAPLGRLLPLSDVTTTQPVGLSKSPYGVSGPELWADPVVVAEGLQLLGARVNPGPYRPGQTVRVGLTWQGDGGLPDLQPALALEQDGTTLAEQTAVPVQGRYPTEQWPGGALVNEVRDLRVPGNATGPASLVLSLGEAWVVLGDVSIEGAVVQFERPAAAVTMDARLGNSIALIGFDPPATPVDPSRPVPVTLNWQALSGEIGANYTIFVHLLAEDGRLIAQHDGLPAGGARPTNEWLAGEFVTDLHELTWRETGYSGPARLIVGLYDPLTGERLSTAEGTDHVRLPVPLTVNP